MAEHILLAQTVKTIDDLQIIDRVIQLLLKDDGGCDFMVCDEYVKAKAGMLSGESNIKTICHNNMKIYVAQPSIDPSLSCTVFISKIYPHLKPAGLSSKLRTSNATSNALAAGT
jgi:hypothetical protein